jgi:hypothetical protein
MPGGFQRSVGCRRDLVRAEGQVGDDDVEAIGESLRDPVPEPTVDQIAVDEDDRRPGPRLPIADSSGRNLDLPCDYRHASVRRGYPT